MNITITNLLKKSSLLSRIGYAYREMKTRQKIKRYDSVDTQFNKILFATTQGRFNDSCKAIAIYLHQVQPTLEMVWVCRDSKYNFDFPDYIRPVLFESDEYFRELATSSVWVFNYLIPQGTVKRDNQLYIQVWHGDKTFKKIANEAARDKKSYRKRTSGRKFLENDLCDYFMTGAELFTEIWERSVGYHGKVLTYGLPRNDILLKEYDPTPICEKLEIPSDKMVLIYAPTFRDHHIDNGNIGTDIDISEVLDILEEKYARQWICLKRSHGGTKLILTGTKEDGRIIDVSQYPDMNDLLLISDMLITDYSSCAGDFAYTGKPVLLYQDDFELYTTKDRSLIFDMKDTPYFVAHNMGELCERIMSLDEKSITENDRKILELYQSTQTDHSTEDICEIIIKHMKSISEGSGE